MSCDRRNQLEVTPSKERKRGDSSSSLPDKENVPLNEMNIGAAASDLAPPPTEPLISSATAQPDDEINGLQQMTRIKEVSTRLMRPTLYEIRVDVLVDTVSRWNTDWENDASVQVFDEGLAQYMLVDSESHYKFYAALILGKAALRCSLAEEEPVDSLDEEHDNVIQLIPVPTQSPAAAEQLDRLKEILAKRGYRFA